MEGRGGREERTGGRCVGWDVLHKMLDATDVAMQDMLPVA